MLNEDEGSTAVADPDNELADELTTNETDEPDGKELSEFEREHYEQIKQLEVEALESEGIYLDAKSEAKATKEVWERQVDRLRSLIRSGPDTQKTLPLVTTWNLQPTHGKKRLLPT